MTMFRSIAWCWHLLFLGVIIATVASSQTQSKAQGKESAMNPAFYRTVQVNGLSIFYREAGPRNA